jgi:hypothetical protein
MEILYPFHSFTCLPENQGPSVHKVCDIYNNRFGHLDTSEEYLLGRVGDLSTR